jgi:NO-binding membrane sensor protein with MHYT domain
MYLIKEFHAGFLFMSLGIAFVGSYATITLYEQFRLCSKVNTLKLFSPTVLLLWTALTLGGVAIWCMHFVGMSSVVLRNENGDIVQLEYEISLTIVSLIAVLVLAYTGFLISSSNKIFTTDRIEVIESFIKESRNLSISQIRKLPSKYQVLFGMLFEGLPHLTAGGIITGIGVCVMHYTGMKAISFHGHIVWNVGIIAASVLIAVVAATAAFWILFRLLSLFPYSERLRVICAIVMAIAVNGMHYTGMAAAEFEWDGEGVERLQKPFTVDTTTETYGALTACAIMVSFVFILSISELRSWYYNLVILMSELDRAADILEMGELERKAQFISIYKHIRSQAWSDEETRITIRSRSAGSGSAVIIANSTKSGRSSSSIRSTKIETSRLPECATTSEDISPSTIEKIASLRVANMV